MRVRLLLCSLSFLLHSQWGLMDKEIHSVSFVTKSLLFQTRGSLITRKLVMIIKFLEIRFCNDYKLPSHCCSFAVWGNILYLLFPWFSILPPNPCTWSSPFCMYCMVYMCNIHWTVCSEHCTKCTPLSRQCRVYTTVPDTPSPCSVPFVESSVFLSVPELAKTFFCVLKKLGIHFWFVK